VGQQKMIGFQFSLHVIVTADQLELPTTTVRRIRFEVHNNSREFQVS
jgi:hypothetical protein